MTSYIRHPATYLWLLLSIITLISWGFGSKPSGSLDLGNAWVTFIVVLLALIKTRFVIRNYMEVRFAPGWLQLTCDIWLLGLLAMIFCLYWAHF